MDMVQIMPFQMHCCAKLIYYLHVTTE